MNIRLDNTSEQNILNMLMDHSLINMDQMNKIKTMSKEIGKSILETAFELNFTSEKKILDILSTSYSLPVVELKSYKIDDKLKKIIPLDYIENNSLVPFEIRNGILKVAIPDASKLSLMKNIKTITKMDPELYAAGITDINNFIYRMTGGEAKSVQKLQQVKKKEKVVPIEVESDVIVFGDKVISEAIDLGASDIHIEAFRNTSKIRFRTDGILKTMDKYSKFLHENYNAVVTRIKIISKIGYCREKNSSKMEPLTFKKRGCRG